MSSVAGGEDDDAEDDIKKKEASTWTKTVREYAEATSIHGIAYIFESGRLSFERLLWLVLVLVLGYLGFVLSKPLLDNFRDNPVLTTVHTSGHPIEKVEFPSITICGQGMVNQVVGECKTIYH